MKKMNSKKMKRVMTAALTALMYVSCTGDVDSPVTSGGGEEDVPVSFDRSVTRVISGGLTTTGNISEMAVFGYVTEGDWTETATPDFMYGQEVTKSGGAWMYSPTKYWPSAASGNKVSFFAVSPVPAGTNGNGISVVKSSTEAGYPVFAVSPPDSPSSQVDFCVASVMNATVEDVNGDAAGFPAGDVPFTFDHVMTQVDFSAKVKGSYAVDVRVKELVLSNVAGSGELTFTGGSPYFSWGSLSNPASYTLSLDDGGIVDAVLGTDVAALSTDPAGVLCLVPQTAAPRVKLLASFGSSDYEVRSDFPSYEWKPGGHYTYSFAINRDDYNLQESSTKWNFSYSTSGQQSFTVPEDGYYKLEAWGAQGGSTSTSYTGGNGGYCSGTIYLKKDQVLYVYVGQAGANSNSAVESWNGGGDAPGTTSWNCGPNARPGGGATDFRLVPGDADTQWDKPVSLNSRILVAGAGGGAGAGYYTSGDNRRDGCYGGGIEGASCFGNEGGQQIGGGISNAVRMNNPFTPADYVMMNGGTFGKGGNANVDVFNDSDVRIYSYVSGGGSGYYGGSAGNAGSWGHWGGPGGGGSSFISGMTGCVAIDPADTTNDPRTQDGGISGFARTTLNYNSTFFGSANSTWVDGEDILFTNCSMIDGAGYQWTKV